ncbi:MAG: metal-dependent hydrolase [Bdellovibrionia bacterium]
MPSIMGHAIVGATAALLSSSAPAIKRRKLFWTLSILCTVVPDADVLTFALGVKYDSFFGHRGFSHSIAFAAVAGFFATAIYLRTLKLKIPKDLGLIFYFFLVTLTHPVLDSMTDGGHGVAFFSPLNIHRYFYTYRPIYVSPLSISEFFNHTGIRVVFRELMFILLPCLLAITFKKTLAGKVPKKLILGVVLVFSFIFPFGLLREELIPGMNGVDVHKIDASFLREKINGADSIPVEDIPGKRLLVNYKDLVKNNLLNTVLMPARQPWSGAFFPSWLGGVSGRWQDLYLVRIWKTLMGDPPPTKSEVLEVLHRAAQGNKPNTLELDKLSPTEKYDIAVGDYYMTATRFESSVRGRGLLDTFPNTPLWAGYCNSISLAAIYEKEPKQTVRVLNPDGYEIKFYPNDIKALLGISYMYIFPKSWEVGNRCELNGPQSDACVDVNPAAVVIALTNLVGLAKTSFLIDKEAFLGIQNAPIRKAEVKVLNPPYFTSERQHFFKVEDFIVKWLVDIEIKLTFSNITALDPSSEEEEVSYLATLGLDQNQNLVGGRWEDPFNHPDFAWGGRSILTGPGKIDDQLMSNRSIEWAIIKEIIEKSSQSTPQNEVVQISKISKNPVSHGFAFQSEIDGVAGGISYLKLSDPVEIYGRLEGENLSKFNSVDLVVLGNSTTGKQDVKLATTELMGEPGASRVFFNLKTRGSLENLENLMLRFNKAHFDKTIDSGFIQFHLPYKQKFETSLNKEVKN